MWRSANTPLYLSIPPVQRSYFGPCHKSLLASACSDIYDNVRLYFFTDTVPDRLKTFTYRVDILLPMNQTKFEGPACNKDA
jgi:hypothetical protein